MAKTRPSTSTSTSNQGAVTTGIEALKTLGVGGAAAIAGAKNTGSLVTAQVLSTMHEANAMAIGLMKQGTTMADAIAAMFKGLSQAVKTIIQGQ